MVEPPKPPFLRFEFVPYYFIADLCGLQAPFSLFMERKGGQYSAMVSDIPGDKIGKATGILRRKYTKDGWLHKLNKKNIVENPKIHSSFRELYSLEKHYHGMTDSDYCVQIAPGII